MELITNWEAFNTASLIFCQFQGMIEIIAITGFVIFRHNLSQRFSFLRKDTSSPYSIYRKGGKEKQRTWPIDE
jgi:hypothetical protein